MFIRFEGSSSVILVDSDFVEPNIGSWEDVINAYEKYNLPVAKNLALSFIWNSKYAPISLTVNQCKKQIPKYLKYANDVEKYLILV